MTEKSIRGKIIKIKDRRFMGFRKMPFMKSRDQVIDWAIAHQPFIYILKTAKKMMVFDANENTWTGFNYQADKRKLVSTKCRSGWGYELYSVLEMEEIDLMPPKKTYVDSQFHYTKDDEVSKWIKEKRGLISFFVKVALISGHIKVNDNGQWYGVDWGKE